jgi:hypothetical protein
VERYKLVHVRNRCHNVWVVSMHTCHSKWIFSVFRLQPLFAFMSSTTVSWINCCASEHFLNPVRLPLGGPWWQTERGMALTAIEWVFNGRVAECGRVPYITCYNLQQTGEPHWDFHSKFELYKKNSPNSHYNLQQDVAPDFMIQQNRLLRVGG